MPKLSKSPGVIVPDDRSSSNQGNPRKLFFEDSQYLTAWKVLLNLRPATLPRADSFFKTFGD